MPVRRTFCRLAGALIGVMLVWPAAAQNSTPSVESAHKPLPSTATPPAKGVSFEEFVDSALRQEQRLTEAMRYFKPVVETYIQDQKHDSDVQTSPKNDDYFLSRLDLTGDAPANREFEIPEHAKQEKEKPFSKNEPAFRAVGFAQSVFPDLEHFDRQNYGFKFVRWEVLGDLRCGVIDVTPRENSSNRGFLGRI